MNDNPVGRASLTWCLVSILTFCSFVRAAAQEQDTEAGQPPQTQQQQEERVEQEEAEDPTPQVR